MISEASRKGRIEDEVMELNEAPGIRRMPIACRTKCPHATGNMSKTELQRCLLRLGLSDSEAALLLSVDPRTVRRWRTKPEEIPGPAEQALLAWARLDECGLAWRPDSLAMGERDPADIAREVAAYRNHAIELDALLSRVRARGGPAAPWVVDLEKRRADLGALSITFYAAGNGSFSPQGYSRRDIDPDLQRDWHLIEDGLATVAAAIAKADPKWSEVATSTRGSGFKAKRRKR
jgi:hypothetical protein